MLMALALLKNSKGLLDIRIIEPNESLGEGVAYSTENEEHRLNVTGIKMGAVADSPGDFIEWLSTTPYPHSPGDFLPRAWYAAYLKVRLAEACEQLVPGSSFSHHRCCATAVHRDGARWKVDLDGQGEIFADAVVLALGLPSVGFPTFVSKPEGGDLKDASRLIASPWVTGALAKIERDESVFILGSGLTAIDAVLSLKSQGHQGPITLVSRHGFLPVSHFTSDPPSKPASVSWPTGDARKIVRKFRELCNEYRWDAVIDAIRPEIPTIWSQLSDKDKSRLIRHCQAFWDVHRHRMAPIVAEKIAPWLKDRTVRVIASRVVKAISHASCVTLTLRPRGRDAKREEAICDRLINCTGYRSIPVDSYHGLLAQMEQAGYLRLDLSRLGLQPTPPLSPRVSEGLYALGALLRSVRWESIAVPELRGQAAEIASLIV